MRAALICVFVYTDLLDPEQPIDQHRLRPADPQAARPAPVLELGHAEGRERVAVLGGGVGRRGGGDCIGSHVLGERGAHGIAVFCKNAVEVDVGDVECRLLGRRVEEGDVEHAEARADGHVASAMRYSPTTGRFGAKWKTEFPLDCLHYCYPGPADYWALALYNLMLNNPRFRAL